MTVRAGAGALAVMLLAIVGAASPRAARAELSLGLTGGMVFAADQQVTVQTFTPSGELVEVASSERVSVNPGGIGGLTLTYWLNPASPWGIQADALYWGSTVMLRGVRRHQVDESRVGVLVSALGRWLLAGPGGPYFYGGFGGGFVYSRVTPGGNDIGPGVQALVGLGMMVTPNIRLRLELRYIVAADVVPSRHDGEVARISGGGNTNPASKIFGSNLDTQFIPAMIGLDWVF